MGNSVIKGDEKYYSDKNTWTTSAYITDQNMRCTVTNKTVLLAGWLRLSKAIDSTTAMIMSGFPKPRDEITLLAWDQNNSTVCAFLLQTDGKIIRSQYGDHSSNVGHYVNFSTTYLIN